MLEALAKRFTSTFTRSTRFVEVGESAGKTIRLPAATLRSIDLKLLGSGFGSVPLDRVLGTMPTPFDLVSKGILRVVVDPVPITDIEAAWNRVENGRRIVFTWEHFEVVAVSK